MQTFEPKEPGLPITLFDHLQGETLAQALLLRKEKILRARFNPLLYGFELGIWKKADRVRADLREKFPQGVITELDLGGNRSSKSKRGCKRVVQDCVANPGHRWWCCDSTESMSRSNQMRYVFDYLPPEWKKDMRRRDCKIRYSMADGFAENIVIFPNQSEITFKFYSMKVTDLPGPELDGVYADELIPFDWIEVLKYRLVNRNGVLHLTFTPEAGWTDTVAYYLDGATTIEESEAELLPFYDGKGNVAGHRKVPRVQQCKEETARIVYFHSKDNPYGNYPGLKQELKTKSPEIVLLRAYGVVDKAHAVAFPRFSQNVHVITTEQWEALQKSSKELERYQCVDPCSGRNWFMIWVACPEPDHWVIYREWPSYGHRECFIDEVGDPGAWTVQGNKPDGTLGPAQKTFGFSLKRYVQEILRRENKEDIRARWIDSRYAQAATLSHESATTLIEQMSELGMDFRASIPESRILGAKDGSIDMINDSLYFDTNTKQGEFSPDLGRINRPKLTVVETCPNVIYSLQHWTGMDGQKGSSKDPIDCIRMVFLSNVGFQGKELYAWQGGRAVA